MRNKVFGYFRGHAVHKPDDPGRHAGVGEAADEIGGRRRGFLGRLDDDRAAGGQRARQLAHDLVDREVPWREGGDWADRLLDHQLIDALRARRDDAPVGSLGLFREPIDDVGTGQHFTLRLRQRLALLQRQQFGDGVSPFAQQVRCLPHNFGPVEGRDPSPSPEPLVRGHQRAVEIHPFAMRDCADSFTGGGIDDRDGVAAGGRGPGAVDKQ